MADGRARLAVTRQGRFANMLRAANDAFVGMRPVAEKARRSLRLRLPTFAADSRFGRRLFTLFLLLAILPLAVSDWLSTAAVTRIADELNQQHRVQVARQMSRQVYERLLGAGALIAALPASMPAPDATRRQAAPGVGRLFLDLTLIDPASRIAWSTASPADAVRMGAMLAEAPVPDRTAGRDGATLSLRSTPGEGNRDDARLWLIRWDRGRPHWVAQLAPDHLWAPLAGADEDGAWRVVDVEGHVLLRHRGSDYPADWSGADEGEPSHRANDVHSELPLDGAFAAGPWQFAQRAPRPELRWHGWPLTAWLALVAAATLMAIAGLGGWQIRRTLVPLQHLTEGTRRLAAGGIGTRVAVARNDEIGTLAVSFNEMASHLENQFDMLAGLTAIDRDILQGTPIDALVHRLLQRLTAAYPGAPARVSWIDLNGRLQVAWRDHTDPADQAAKTSGLVLDADALADFASFAEDRCDHAPATDAGRPWLPNDAAPSQAWRVVLPLRVHGGTLALIALALPAPPPPEVLQPARDLRDRLAVAFASHARERELLHRAFHDGLTGLANRYGLHQALESRLAAATPLTLLFIDLDHFKDVNDSRGHAVGDALLRQAADRLQAGVPQEALVARPGGDEFAVVLDGDDAARAERLADKLIAMLSRAFKVEEHEHVLSASIGIALAPLHGQTRDELLRRADVALYDAKASGRARHRLFGAELDTVARERVDLLADMRRALQRREFVVHYQPRVDWHDGNIRSAEALVRWQHPGRGLLLPGVFIELAESSGLIDALGQQVLEISCAQLAVWRRQDIAIDRVSVNVSARQLASGELPARVQAALAAHTLPAHMLELEVTESLLAKDQADAHAQLALMRGWGVTIALDDFGTGYSSMATLRELPIDVMKIDRAFVADLCHDSGARAVASAIVALARSMGLSLVAEGVETEDQAQALRAMGCDELQGFLFSRALPVSAFDALPGVGQVNAAQTA